MIGPLGFFLPDNIISVSSNTACERGGKVQVVFDEFKLSRSPIDNDFDELCLRTG